MNITWVYCINSIINVTTIVGRTVYIEKINVVLGSIDNFVTEMNINMFMFTCETFS